MSEMEKRIFKVLQFIYPEIRDLERDNTQLSHFQNPNPKGKEIERLEKIAKMLEEGVIK